VPATSRPWSISSAGGHQAIGHRCKSSSTASTGSLANSRSYSTSADILQYLKNLAEKYGLMKYIKLRHKVVGAWWNEENQEWSVDIQRGDDPTDIIHDKCNVLFNAGGVLK